MIICMVGREANITNMAAYTARLKKNKQMNWNHKGLVVFNPDIIVLYRFLNWSESRF